MCMDDAAGGRHFARQRSVHVPRARCGQHRWDSRSWGQRLRVAARLGFHAPQPSGEEHTPLDRVVALAKAERPSGLRLHV